ncbi:MAG TPA: NADH:flavin oxidoreductase, partial [Clostridiaceae bacterium]|nr:NADH:flavin oxidoreductase [Clostridiaceae bacterium]
MTYLNKPLATGKLTLKNRLVLPAMHYVAGGPNGEMNSATLDYYEEKTRGGYLGLVVTQHFYMTMQGKASAGQISIADDSTIEVMRELVGVIHGNGSKVVAQVIHAGSAASASVTGLEVVGASSVGNPGKIETPRQ